MTTDDHDAQADRLRALADAVLARARDDAAYLAELRADPERVLVEAGLPTGAARQVAQDELGDDTDDTSGFRMGGRGTRPCSYTCDAISCLVTWCSAVPYSN
jgi:hypothetical protein